MSQAKDNEFEQGVEIAPGVKYGGTEQLAQDKIEARIRYCQLNFKEEIEYKIIA